MERRANKRALIIGLDGATWDLLKPWAEEGGFPVLLGKINPQEDKICFLLNSLLARVFKRKGYMFSAVLVKST